MKLEAIYEDLMDILASAGELPDSSSQAEIFIAHQIAPFGTDDRETILSLVRECTAQWYRAIGPRPPWIPAPEWQYASDGEPTIFVGDIQFRLTPT